MINEYIPGDLVMYNTKVNKIEETINTTYVELEDYAVSIPIYDIKPIPLTPEILQKNGWKYTKIAPSLYQYYKDDIYIKYDKLEEKFKFDDLYWSAYSFEIPYVHTLQHLLFGLGLKTEMEV